MKLPPMMEPAQNQGRIDQDAIDLANAQLETLVDGFIEWAMGETVRAEKTLQVIQKTQVANDKDVSLVFDVMHNLKGQGGTFGFDLITLVGGIGCEILRPPVDLNPARTSLLQSCLSAIKSVLANRLRGDGGPVGQELIDRLEAMVGSSGDQRLG